MSSIILRKTGGFYSVYGDDSYILYYLFGYRIIDDRVGFPLNSYNKIINILNEKSINYIINGTNIDANFKRKNKYNKFLELGKKKYSLDYRIKCICNKLDSLSEENIDEILNTIENYYER